MSSTAPYTCSFCGTASSGGGLTCPACASPIDVEKVVSPSGWEELPPIPDLARIQIGHSTCQIEGALVPVADFSIARGDSVYFAHHTLLWTEPQVTLETMTLAGGWTRALAGMPVVMVLARGPGRIAFSHDDPGEMVALPLQAGQSVDVREHVLVAATGDVRYDYFSSSIYFSGREGLHYPVGNFMDRFVAATRPGLVLVHGAGNVFVRRLGDYESLLVHPSALLFKDSTVGMHLHVEVPFGGTINGWSAYGWLRVYGPGRVAIRSAYGPAENVSLTGVHSPWTVRRLESAAAWYFLRDGEQQGPTSLDYIQGMVLATRLPAETQIWSEGLTGWVPAQSIGLCTYCKTEQPLVLRKYRPRTAVELFFFILFFVPCLPFMLLSLFFKFRYCTHCGRIVK